MRVFTGVAASPGIVVGKLKVVDRQRVVVNEHSIATEDVAVEIERLKKALSATRAELEILKVDLEGTTGDEHLFFIDTHLLILADERLLVETAAIIETGLINAEGALLRTLQKYRTTFEAIEDAYLRERISDVETVVEKVLRTMTGEAHAVIFPNDGLTIIAAHDITPADILQMDRSHIVGLITEVGRTPQTGHHDEWTHASQLAGDGLMQGRLVELTTPASLGSAAV
ncbi:MAG: hypothetical protein H7X83_05505, partial [Verrucomicrobia bacterium]|nr:hypothetical protein [Deltaproteobacteria bacterium]